MKFKAYWDGQGARYHADTHEDRARHAWQTLDRDFKHKMIGLQRMVENLDLPNFSCSIAVGDVLSEIREIIYENET